MQHRISRALAVAALLYLSACGQTGPLYLPEQAPEQAPEETTDTGENPDS